MQYLKVECKNEKIVVIDEGSNEFFLPSDSKLIQKIDVLIMKYWAVTITYVIQLEDTIQENVIFNTKDQNIEVNKLILKMKLDCIKSLEEKHDTALKNAKTIKLYLFETNESKSEFWCSVVAGRFKIDPKLRFYVDDSLQKLVCDFELIVSPCNAPTCLSIHLPIRIRNAILPCLFKAIDDEAWIKQQSYILKLS